jgi:hypothetical protein
MSWVISKNIYETPWCYIRKQYVKLCILQTLGFFCFWSSLNGSIQFYKTHKVIDILSLWKYNKTLKIFATVPWKNFCFRVCDLGYFPLRHKPFFVFWNNPMLCIELVCVFNLTYQSYVAHYTLGVQLRKYGNRPFLFEIKFRVMTLVSTRKNLI